MNNSGFDSVGKALTKTQRENYDEALRFKKILHVYLIKYEKLKKTKKLGLWANFSSCYKLPIKGKIRWLYFAKLENLQVILAKWIYNTWIL